MFEQSLALGVARTDTRWTTLISAAAQCAMIGAGILLPLVFTETLPKVRLAGVVTAPSPPPPPPPLAVAVARPAGAAPRPFYDGRLHAPQAVPSTIALTEDEVAAAAAAGAGVPGGIGVPGGVMNGVLHGIIGAVASAVLAPPPPPAVQARQEPPAEAPARIRVGGLVQAGRLVHGPLPVYPPLARQARIAGVVRLEGIVGKDGRIRELRVVSGHPLLVPAALAAVRTWIYQPAVLNGDAVEVIAPIDVWFQLH